MENLFIKEDVYQEIKKKMNKKSDYFTIQELKEAMLIMKEGAN